MCQNTKHLPTVAKGKGYRKGVLEADGSQTVSALQVTAKVAYQMTWNFRGI